MKIFLILTIIASLLVFSNIVLAPSHSEKNEQNFSMGKIEWSEKCHPLVFNTGLVRVIDPDMDRDPNAPDKFEIKVWSDFAARNDYRGKVLSHIAIETGNSTGIFESTVFWGDPWDDSLGHRVPIWDNSTVTALYVDDTLPPPLSKVNVTSSLIVNDVDPIYKKLRNGTSIPYYIYGPCTMQFLDTARYQFPQKIEFIFPSPSEQLTEGVPLDKIKCKENLILIKKTSDENLVCVKPETKTKLIKRGWAVEAKPEPEDKNDFVIDKENKVDFSNPKIPRDKEGRIDYDKLNYLVSKPQFEKLLAKRNIEFDSNNIVLMVGPRVAMYTTYSGLCGYVIAADNEDYWLKSFLDYDTLTEAKIMNENPDPCKPNYGSCFCDAQIHKAENTMKELSYLTVSEEETIGKTVSKYLNNTKIANVPDKFVVGKYNLESNPYEIPYCGQFIWDAHDVYFEGYIKNSNVVGFGLAFEKPKLCGINDNAQIFYFDKSSIQYD